MLCYDSPVIYGVVNKKELKELDKLVKSGQVRATCPHCLMLLESVFVRQCKNCNGEINSDEILVSVIDWSKAN